MTTQFYSWMQESSRKLFDTEALLTRYPRLESHELSRLIETLPALSSIDRAVLTADDQFSEKLSHFYRDHHRMIEAPMLSLLMFALLPLLAASVRLWWMTAG